MAAVGDVPHLRVGGGVGQRIQVWGAAAVARGGAERHIVARQAKRAGGGKLDIVEKADGTGCGVVESKRDGLGCGRRGRIGLVDSGESAFGIEIGNRDGVESYGGTGAIQRECETRGTGGGSGYLGTDTDGGRGNNGGRREGERARERVGIELLPVEFATPPIDPALTVE